MNNQQMDKITLISEKAKVMLDIYSKYLQDYILLMPEDLSYLSEYKEIFTFNYWFDNKAEIQTYRANKLYGEESLNRLRAMGMDINIVKSLDPEIQEIGGIQKKLMRETQRLALQLNSQPNKIIRPF